MSLTSQVGLTVSAAQITALDLGEAKATLAKAYSASLASGVAAGQADRIFHDQRTIAPSSNDDLDLAGVLLDALGGTITLARVKALIVVAAAGNTNDVVVGGAATPFVSLFGDPTDKVKVRPGATLALFAGAADATGYVTAAGASDLLRVANGGAGTSVTYDVVIIGASA